MNRPIQFEYCVPESQKLADLFGILEDLKRAIRYSDLHIEIDPTAVGISIDEIMRREDTRQALCRAAFVSYVRCFGTGVRSGLGVDFLERLSSELQQRHRQVKDLRDKWVTHSVNFFDDVRVRLQATHDASGELEVKEVTIASQSVGGFIQAWMIAFRDLFIVVRDLVQHDISAESQRLLEQAKKIPIEKLRQMERVDGVPLTRKTLDPSQSRGKF